MSPGNTTATQATTEPTASAMDTSWLYPSDSEVVATVRRVTSASLAAYREQPLHLEEHLRVEADVASGAYFSRQVYELVQNAADAILEGGAAGRIELVQARGADWALRHRVQVSARHHGSAGVLQPFGLVPLLCERVTRPDTRGDQDCATRTGAPTGVPTRRSGDDATGRDARGTHVMGLNGGETTAYPSMSGRSQQGSEAIRSRVPPLLSARRRAPPPRSDCMRLP